MTGRRSLSAPHLLVVDADPARRAADAALLAACGARVSAAANSAEALRLVAGRRFDAAVVDQALGGPGAIVLVAQVRASGNGRDVPVLLFHSLPAGDALDREAERTANLGGVRLLARPVTGDAVAGALGALTARV